jgi:hypothetical protein
VVETPTCFSNGCELFTLLLGKYVRNSGENKLSMQKTTSTRFARVFLWTSMLILVLAATGCKKDPRLEFIEGAWYYKDAHLANIPGESFQTTDWVFNNYYLTMNTCCFIEASYSGNFSVADRDENKLTLDLFNLKGHMGGMAINKDDTLTIVIKIDPDTDTIKIDGDGPYIRVRQ